MVTEVEGTVVADHAVGRYVRPGGTRGTPGTPGTRGTRPITAIAVLAGAWTAAYAVIHVLVASRQDEPAVAWWYVALLAVAALLVLVAPVTRARTALASVAAVLLAGCALLGLLSLGLLLVPGAVLAILVAVLPGIGGGRHGGA